MMNFGEYQIYNRELNQYLKTLVIPLIKDTWGLLPPSGLKVRLTPPVKHHHYNSEGWTNTGDPVIYINQDKVSDNLGYKEIELLLHEAVHQVLGYALPLSEGATGGHSPFFNYILNELGVLTKPSNGTGIGLVFNSPLYNALIEHHIPIPSVVVEQG